MKMTNLKKFQTLLLTLVVGSALLLGSCSKDSSTTVVAGDKTALTALIAQADALVAAASPNDYPQAAIDNFTSTLQTVKTAAAATNLTQAQINNLVTQLTEAMATFNAAAYGFIDDALYLKAGWHFDEGTGSTATGFSSAQHVATFAKSWTTLLGTDAALPTWVDGVKGGKAVYLTNGAHLEVPYSTDFLPADITISVWVKLDNLGWENNIIVSQNYWWGYKFQTQSGTKPMITERIDANTVQDFDDGDGVVAAGVWSQLVVSLNSTTNTLTFYINGVKTQTYTETNGVGPLTQTLSYNDGTYTYTPQPFLIGTLATDDEIAAHPDNFSWITTANVGCFEGAIDELRIYSIALTDGQVSKLYNDEKP